MAVATSDLDDIDEKFLHCPICKEQLQEPRRLTCLHRFCSGCLSKLLQTSRGVVKCPECMEGTDVPEHGVTGFKTDFHSKNLMEFIRLKNLLVENKGTKECCSCSKIIAPCSKQEQESPYCWECRGFLCQACHQFHRTGRDTKYHLLTIFNLKDPKIHNLGIVELSQLVDSPRCLKHPENIMRLCCVSCNYDPICITCIHGDHRDHTTEDINTRAQKNKVNLKENLTLLHGYKSSIYKLQEEAKSGCKNNDLHYEKRKTSLKDCYKSQGGLVEQIRKNIMLHSKNRTREIERKYENSVAKLTTDMEKEIQQIRDKYAVILHKKVAERDDLIQKIKTKSQQKLSILEQQEKNVTRRFLDSEKALQTIQEKTDVRFVTALQHSENIIKRYENLIATASSILAADNDWTAVQCVPDICSAAKLLIEDTTNSLTALTGISQSWPSEVLLPVDVTAFRVSYRESIVNIQGKDIYAKSLIDGIVNVPGEGIIINGQTGDGGGYSRCINIYGKVLWSDVSEYYFGVAQNDVQVYKMKAAVMCFPDAITTLNRENQRRSIWGVQLSEMINHWPTKLSLQCVATDPLKKRVFAAFQDCRDIYVFNDILKLIATFSLPPKAKYPFALAVSVGGLLIVCDASGKGVFSTNMVGELQSTYLLPSLDSCDEWIPQSVCNDSKDNVFVLLRANEFGKVVVQYRKHGGHPVAFRRVGSEMSHIAVTQVDQGEKLLLVGCTWKKLLVYSTTPYSDEHDKVEEESHEDSPVTSVQQQGTNATTRREPLISPEYMV
ncbi:E3 ubiquitin-protein ligase TRIM56 [Holothuria leucospilota]|uniref:E3 ubiquitin-protein ligase TRIM56 n=1 Tax=Holothuria leucospilota TaxID=206669 RepID=A0A9Q1C8C2_HOLLE|nr:E3 ubiquitin-protein ligase TRIM56 [Holothuria leucospilota]